MHYLFPEAPNTLSTTRIVELSKGLTLDSSRSTRGGGTEKHFFRVANVELLVENPLAFSFYSGNSQNRYSTEIVFFTEETNFYEKPNQKKNWSEKLGCVSSFDMLLVLFLLEQIECNMWGFSNVS